MKFFKRTYLFLGLFLSVMNATNAQNTYDNQWELIDSLERKGLYRKALEKAQSIFDLAYTERNTNQIIKSSIFQLKYNQQITEDDYILGIHKLKNLIATTETPARQVLHSILADVYYGYYSLNRWKFSDRTNLAEEVKIEDVRTWDLERLAKAVIFHYQASLENRSSTENLPLKQFETFITIPDDESLSYYTLFDFLAERAFTFFSKNSFNIEGPAETFQISEPDYFKSSTAFLKLKLTTKDSFNLKFYAAQTLQTLTESVASKRYSFPKFKNKLERLKFAKQYSTLANKDELYIEAIKALTITYKDQYFIGEAWYEIAQELWHKSSDYDPLNKKDESRWDVKKAVEICDRVIKNYPETYGAKKCAALLSQIKQKTLAVTTERAYLPETNSTALIEYKNINELYLKIVPVDPDKKFKSNELRDYLNTKDGVYQHRVDLKHSDDFRQHSAEVLIPELELGYYYIVASNSKKFSDSSGYTYSGFWVTQLSYQTKTIKNNVEVLALCRKTGHPIENAEIKVKYRDYNRMYSKYVYKTIKTYKTDKNGKAIVTKLDNNRQLYFSIKSGADHYEPKEASYHYWNNYTPHRNTNITLFTDRKLYRPGQTIYFKGIVVENYQNENKLIPGYQTSVAFMDVNHQSIESINVTSNEYGSFEGQFVAPLGVLTGSMQIRTSYGSVNVQVEEYKRPKFTVAIDTVKGEYQLNDSIPVTGFAEAFSGSKISDAKVVYRVQRTTRYNYWRWWYRPSVSKEVMNGVTTTDANGQFELKFKAIPDASQKPEDLPIFNYTITADVIDINGETHSATHTFSLGYQSLILSNGIVERYNQNNDFEFSISASSLNGEPLFVDGNYTISKLKTPDQTYTNRLWRTPDVNTWTENEFHELFPNKVYFKEDDFRNWQIEKEVSNVKFNTKNTSKVTIEAAKKWSTGKYKYEAESTDKKGVKVKDVKYFTVYNPNDKQPALNHVFEVDLARSTVRPGENAEIILSTAEKHLNVLYSVNLKGVTIEEKWLHLKHQQEKITLPVAEKHIGGFTVEFTVIKHNRIYNKTVSVTVPEPDTHLDISFESFRNKLLPGQDEEWTIIIKNAKNQKAQAELLASLYDASLDELFTANSFNLHLNSGYYRSINWSKPAGFGTYSNRNMNYRWNSTFYAPGKAYPHLNYFGYRPAAYGFRSLYGVTAETVAKGGLFDMDLRAPNANKAVMVSEDEVSGEALEEANVLVSDFKNEEGAESYKWDQSENSRNQAENSTPSPQPRKNFNETAFFYPQLHTNADGEIRIKFTIPESLTKWRFIGLAHSKTLEIGTISKELITQKELMVVPNAPRFLREGDQIEISSKISNLSEGIINGSIELTLLDPSSEKDITSDFNVEQLIHSFTVNSGENTDVSWHLSVPKKYSAVKYRIMAKSPSHADGEENVLPILSNRMLVTESMPMPMSGKGAKTFKFKKLLNNKSETLQHHNLALEFTSNPAWYAIQAMPYMMEYPYECSEQTFTRYYSNALATHVMNSSPKIKQVIDQWANESPDAFLSNLQKNQELKALLLEETPWVLSAKSESQTKKNLAVLLDLNRMKNELSYALNKTIKNQSPNGGWSWFPGMRPNRYITQHIITGMGHLNELGVADVKQNRKTWKMVKKGVQYLDREIVSDFQRIQRVYPNYENENHINHIQVQYLYARSYFKDIKMNQQTEAAVAYFSNQAKTYWLSFNLYAKGMIGLSAKRMEMNDLASDVYKSLKDNAIVHEEFGMYWKSYKPSFYWYEAPIETQALMIEFFNAMDDIDAVEKLKIWLLKEKQTTHWKTTKQTTEAVYALLLNGTDLLASDELVQITIGDRAIEYIKENASNPYQVKTEAGTGYFKTSWTGDQVKNNMGKVKVEKNNTGVAWGALYWQYFEDLDKITFHKTPLKLDKALYKVELTPRGEKLSPISSKNPINIGDKVRVRIELRTDRNLEYVHMKDMRAASFEPLNVISSYHYQGGLGYYQATKDAATNFFFDYIPKGTYVFEYDLRAQQKGNFSNGLASIQCMYAPEFTSHSDGIRVVVE